MPDEKPYEATPSRLQAARKKGDFARSQEVAGVLSFAAAIVVCSASAHTLGAAFHAAITAAAYGRINVVALIWAGVAMSLPAAAAAGGAILATIVQGRGFRLTAPSLDVRRLSPAPNLARIWSRQALIAAARGAAAFALALAALIPSLCDVFGALLGRSSIADIAAGAWTGALRSAGVACVVGGVFAVVDYGVQMTAWRARLRMSFEEMRRDHKEHEGDPHARGRRASLHRRIVRGSLERLAQASFVVTNPTHIAVALQYAPPGVPVPVVLVAAADEVAARVRERAKAYRIPIIENVELARALFASASPGSVIPPDLYVAVAQVLAALSPAPRMTS